MESQLDWTVKRPERAYSQSCVRSGDERDQLIRLLRQQTVAFQVDQIDLKGQLRAAENMGARQFLELVESRKRLKFVLDHCEDTDSQDMSRILSRHDASDPPELEQLRQFPMTRQQPEHAKHPRLPDTLLGTSSGIHRNAFTNPAASRRCHESKQDAKSDPEDHRRLSQKTLDTQRHYTAVAPDPSDSRHSSETCEPHLLPQRARASEALRLSHDNPVVQELMHLRQHCAALEAHILVDQRVPDVLQLLTRLQCELDVSATLLEADTTCGVAVSEVRASLRKLSDYLNHDDS